MPGSGVEKSTYFNVQNYSLEPLTDNEFLDGYRRSEKKVLTNHKC